MASLRAIENNEPIDFTKLPDSVIWMNHGDNNENQVKCCFEAKRKIVGTCVAIHKIPQKVHDLARRLSGQFYSDEEVEGKNLISICKIFDVPDGHNIVMQMYKFAVSCCTGIQGLNYYY
jgi:hypothetical protein